MEPSALVFMGQTQTLASQLAVRAKPCSQRLAQAIVLEISMLLSGGKENVNSWASNRLIWAAINLPCLQPTYSGLSASIEESPLLQYDARLVL